MMKYIVTAIVKANWLEDMEGASQIITSEKV